jgi:hypothetical protein
MKYLQDTKNNITDILVLNIKNCFILSSLILLHNLKNTRPCI